MAIEGTHITELKGLYNVAATAPTDPEIGDLWFNSANGTLNKYTSSGWLSFAYTSTSTTTTTTSTSTTTTSSSTSSSTSTSTTTTSTSTTL